MKNEHIKINYYQYIFGINTEFHYSLPLKSLNTHTYTGKYMAAIIIILLEY